ncbi:MAG: HAD-IC family P-type ATPase, partial [Thermanaerothrix sp.]|nr:HAD-IC family P-type ATPase [Thermanaerothrix sp.]
MSVPLAKPTVTTAGALPPSDLSIAWHALNAHETIRRLRTPLETGLTTEEAKRRLAQFGPNQLAEAKRRTFLHMVIGQLNNFVVILLIVAAIISGAISLSQSEPLVDSAAIIAIVILNAVLGVIQESRAEQALATLRQLAAPEALVLRDGRRQTIPARELVPGDIVFLEAGNYVPADLRLLEAVNLRVEEAALTGESVAVEKDATTLLKEDAPLGDRKNTAFMGTLVVYGRGRGVVVSTGMRTQLGMIATLLQTMEEEETPLQRKLDQLGKTLGIAALAICGLVFLTGILQGGHILEMFMVAVSLAIAAVPEGLPAIVTISLALGMREMIRRHALIRRLSSVETLGSATVICSDKTGTLTQNAMTVTRIWVDGTFIEVSGHGYVPEGEFRVDGKPLDFNQYPAVLTALWIGALNNDAVLEVNTNNGEKAYRIVGDPTEGALLVAAAKAGALPEQLQMAYPREDEVPFDSVRKRMVTVHAVRNPHPADASPFGATVAPDLHVVTVKGAPDEVLRLCRYFQDRYDQPQPLDDATRQ